MRALMIVAALLLPTGLAFGAIDFSNFHNPTQVQTEMENLVSSFPTLARIETIGTSLEGRQIKALKISDNVSTNEPNEGDVIFVAAHHAREWISVEMTLYLAEYLLTHYATDSRVRADMDNLQIWIVPIVNPDGVVYSWSSWAGICPTDPSNPRYWRKNRRVNGDGTFGVDLNRNWGFEWGLNSGSSPNTNNDTYRGPSAFSEPETQAIRNLVTNATNLKALVTYHSFSELFLRPWGYSTSDPPGESTLKSISDRSIAAIAAVHGHTYSDTIWYTASGETTDYLWGSKRTAAFTPELRPGPGGVVGFCPPPSEILPSNQENLPAALALIHDAGAREVWIKDHPADTGQEPSAVWTSSGWSHAFWESPDIWTVPATLDQGATVDLHVRMHNHSGGPVHDVTVDVYYTDPRISLEFPNPNATLIGSWTGTVPPAGREVTLPWSVPIGTNSWGERHWCVGAVIKHANDMPLTTEAQRTSNVGIRNFNTTEIIAAGTLNIAATNYLAVASELLVNIDRSSIPEGWKVFLPEKPIGEYKVGGVKGIHRKAKLLDSKGILLEPGETVNIPIRVEPPHDVDPDKPVDIRVHGALVPLVAGKRDVVNGNGYTFRVTGRKPCRQCEDR